MAALCCLLVSRTDERMVLGDRRRRFLRTTPNNLLELAILGKPLVSALFLFCKRETWRRKRSVNESKDGGLKGRR